MAYTQTKDVLNQLVADLSQFSVIIHQHHWYARGVEFLTFHEDMDKFMDEINEQLDVIAERLIILNGSPYSTLQEFAEHSQIETTKGDWQQTIPQRVEALVVGYRYLASVYKKGIQVAGQEGDDVTQDICTGFKAAMDKKIWLLQAKLGKAANLEENKTLI